MTTTCRTAACRTAGWGLAAAGALHLLWASGSPWPAGSREVLADAVTGSRAGLPPAPLTVAVGAGLIGAGVASATTSAGGDARARNVLRGVVGAGLLARAVLGGRRATQVLGMAEPSERFLGLDRRCYRPLVGVLGAGVLAGIERGGR
ncbi:DUF3995 domain-containing protein [Pimelobacter sp. 30-1]|uniref:DUF3995 domain-containing protein n=1 Tax=Pimelobacter sp. 30-1 TaxID=2004991 RepID=UPI001C055983|nr:DUF3995 domain-containing protein [Pimelobacter sp. 30-1]MBU2697358.1 hypothetical protein [Pimelobacter sp. 30-1]